MNIRVLRVVGRIGLIHEKEVSTVMTRLFPMQTKGKAFRAVKTHLNLKSTKKRIEILSVSNAWGMAILLHNVQTSG